MTTIPPGATGPERFWRHLEGRYGNRSALPFASGDRLVYAVGTAGVKHRRIPRIHSQSIYTQLLEPGVHREPMVAVIKALEDASLAPHVERQWIVGIDNYRVASAHVEPCEA